jgi:hypothetical protein
MISATGMALEIFLNAAGGKGLAEGETNELSQGQVAAAGVLEPRRTAMRRMMRMCGA